MSSAGAADGKQLWQDFVDQVDILRRCIPTGDDDLSRAQRGQGADAFNRMYPLMWTSSIDTTFFIG